MIANIEQPTLGQLVTIVSKIVKDQVNPTYNVVLHQHQLHTEQIRGNYRYQFTRTYKSPVSAIVGVPSAVYETRWESSTREDAESRWKRGVPITSTEPFTILGVGRKNQTCTIPMPDHGEVSLYVAEDFELRISAGIPAPSTLLSTLGGYCRVDVIHPNGVPAAPICGGSPDYTGSNIMAKDGTSLPMDGPFYLRPAILKPGSQYTLGSFVVFRPARVNWEYWDSNIGFGPVIRHETYCSPPGR